MIKRLLRTIAWIITCAYVLLIITQLILAYPGFLFEEELNHENFRVHSNEKPSAELSEILEDISNQLRQTGFYEETDPMKIVLCSKSNLTSFFDLISLAPAGAGFHHFSGTIYLFPKRIHQFRRENLKVKGEEERLLQYSYQNFECKKVLTHEILHKLHSDTLGMWEFKQKMPPPHWKAEGFAEYYTFKSEKEEDQNYSFRDRVALYLRYKEEFPLFYYKSQLLYEFLAEHQNLAFAAIMEDEVTEEKAYEELMDWYND